MLKPGDKAPMFELPDASMEMLDLSAYLGKHTIVLFFYTRDNAPQCTTEAIEFSDNEDAFVRQNAVVFGVSRDHMLSHAEFRDKHGLSAQLLSDEDGEVARSYGVLQETEHNGVTRRQIGRVTYIIDRDGIVCHVVPVQQAHGHAAEVLKLVKEMK